VDADARDDNFTVLRSNGQYFLTEDETGFAIWSVRADNEEPVLTFPTGTEGRGAAERALRRETRLARWAGILLVTAIVSAAAWVLDRVLQEALQLAGVEFALPYQGFDPFKPQHVPFSWTFLVWVELTQPVLYALFIVAVGLSVVLWLHRRFRREG